MRRLVLAALVVLSWGVVTSAPALAGGNSSTPCAPVPQASTCTFTQNIQGAVQTFPTNVPCVDPNNNVATGLLTITYNAVFHVTVNTAGNGWVTMTATGDFSFTPFDPSRLSYTGHFETWFGGSFNKTNAVIHSTLNGRGTGSDGSTLTFHLIFHINFDVTGAITLQFDKAVC